MAEVNRTKSSVEFHEQDMADMLEVRDVSYFVGDNASEKQLLHSVNAVFRPKSLVALMGPSGAGKSTLLKTLACRSSGRRTGQVLYGGKKVVPKSFRMLTNVIPQDDILLNSLSPRDMITYTTRLRLGNLTELEQDYKIKSIIQELSLSSCADTVIGDVNNPGCSGGQRKRVSVALELINDPSILFVDEPTSGLDSKTAHDVLRLLGGLARKGKIVICTVHQPSFFSFSIFDELLLLHQGAVCYFGSLRGAVPYFQAIGYPVPQYSNPADHFLEILQIDRTPSTLASSAHSSSSTSKEMVHSQFSSVAFSEGVKGDGMFRGDIKLQEFADMSTHESSSLPNMFAECWERFAEEKMTKEGQGQRSHSKMLAFPSGNGEREEEEEVEHQGFHLSVFDQTCILIQRNFQIVLQDKSQFLVRLLGNLCLALLFGLVYFSVDQNWIAQNTVQGKQSVLFAAVLTSVMDSTTATIIRFPVEKAMLMREYNNGYYQLRSFYMAYIVTSFTFQTLYTCVYGAVVFFLTAMYSGGANFGIFITVQLLLSYLGTMMGLIAGALAKDINFAQSMVPVCLLPLMIFSGFLQHPDNISPPFIWCYHLSFFQYGFTSLVINEFRYSYFKNCSDEDYANAMCPYGTGVVSGEVVVQALGFSDRVISESLLVLGGFVLVSLLSGYKIVHRMARKRV